MVRTTLASVTIPSIERGDLTIEELKRHPIPLTDIRRYDDMSALLPTSASGDHLLLITGTHGTDTWSIKSQDVKTLGAVSKFARFIYVVPPWFLPGNDLQIDFRAGMDANAADNSATLDLEAFLTDKEGSKSGSDLVTSAAQTINSTTLATKSFVIDTTSLVVGDVLDCLITTAIDDAAGGSAVQAKIGEIVPRLDIAG